ncbi:asparaginase [Nonomuraea sp. NBC_01738]|uniref:asparaginase n=1 Tax=Nonomuraea sp. NBC_01738 TaxID=2976003 RepID=UPI002E0D3562|nr:asparaginase [Nonomuraea sp. NBC_01738]
MPDQDAVVLAEVVRGGFVESRHRGHLVVLDRGGAVRQALGDVAQPMLPRSALKPLQAAGMVRAGLRSRGRHLALACASHSGEPVHARLAADLLARHGLSPDDLRGTPDLPLEAVTREAHLRAGKAADRLHANCSGKHAAMLATCVVNGWSREDYLDPGHPLHKHLRHTVEELAGEGLGGETVDGCGAPAMAVSLTGLARGFAALATAAPGSAEGDVARAMREQPWMVGGRGREVSRLIDGVPGLIAKDAAEGVAAAALPDGRAVAVKIEDGDPQWRGVFRALVAGLRLAGADAAVLDDLATLPVLGHGRTVGEVRPAASLTQSLTRG